MSYTFAYSEERVREGKLESACEVKEDGTAIARFAVWGYKTESERDEMAKARLVGLLPTIAKIKEDKSSHPMMKKTATVDEKDLPKGEAKAIG